MAKGKSKAPMEKNVHQTGEPNEIHRVGKVAIDRGRFLEWLQGWRVTLAAEGISGVRSNVNIKRLAFELDDRLSEILRKEYRSSRPKRDWLLAGPDAIEKWNKESNFSEPIYADISVARALSLIANQDLTLGLKLDQEDFNSDPGLVRAAPVQVVRHEEGESNSDVCDFSITIPRVTFGQVDARKLSGRGVAMTLSTGKHHFERDIGFVRYGLANAVIEISFTNDIKVLNEIDELRSSEDNDRGEIRGGSLIRESATGDQTIELRVDGDGRDAYIRAVINKMHICDVSLRQIQDEVASRRSKEGAQGTATVSSQDGGYRILEIRVITRNGFWTSFSFDTDWLKAWRDEQERVQYPDEDALAQQLIQAILHQRSKGEWLISRQSRKLS
jgi:hypothetical protein